MHNIIICSYDQKLLPTKGTSGSVCWDMSNAQEFTIQPWEILKIWTGVKTFMPQGRGSRMYSRSSTPTKTGLMVANAVAVFDSDFRGEYLMQLYNYTSSPITIPSYTRLMQIEFFPYLRENKQFWSKEIPDIELLVDEKLYHTFAEHFPSERGVWWIGSTG